MRELNVECGRAERDGKRLVIFTCGSDSHRERINTDDAFQRKQARERAIPRLGLDDDAHEELEVQIIQAADLVDARAESEPLVQCSTVRLSEVAPEQVEWLWHERFAIGKLTLLVGDPGQGKSFFTLDLAARVSRGAPWPDAPGDHQPAGDVILLGAEDDLGDTIRPRLDAHDADVSRIIAIKGTRTVDDDHDRMVNLSTDLDSIRRVVESANNPRAIVIDPVSAYLGKVDSHNNAEVRAVLAPLAELAAQTRVAVIAVSHLRKGEGEAIYRTMGSLAFIAAARSAWVICRDDADHSRRLLLPIKSNIAPDVGGLAFTIAPHPFREQPCVLWESEPVSVAADDAIGQQRRKRGPEPNERDDAARWLREQLADGSRPAKDIQADGVGCGFSRRTIYRAFQEIDGKSAIGGFPACARWSLDGCATPGTTD